MLHGFTERFPTRVIVWPVRVQGETCAAEVAAAIRGFNAIAPGGRVPRPDVLIVARGGGSLEDLWGFNEEIVVRAAAESRIPLISAVGHETDWTLIDLVADARAPTPTKAAEWAVPKHAELAAANDGARAAARALRCARSLEASAHRSEGGRARAAAAGGSAGPAAPALRCRREAARPRAARQHARACHAPCPGRGAAAAAAVVGAQRARLGAARQRLGSVPGGRSAGLRVSAARARAGVGRLGPQLLSNRLQRRRDALEGHAKLLVSLSYQSVLQRGFALVRDSEGERCARRRRAGRAIASTSRCVDGHIDAEVNGSGAAVESVHDSGRARRRSSGAASSRWSRARRGKQGSLF